MDALWLALAILAAPVQDLPASPSFGEWRDGVRAEALARGIRQEIVDEALGSIEQPDLSVIERDRGQVELALPLEKYLAQRVSPTIVRTARRKLAAHRAVLARVARQYGVSERIIVGIWGLESNFGAFSGVRPTVGALATLAWDRRRSALFRAELLEALEILNGGDVDLPRLRGSWAGAMGQPQFMPSSYRKYAEDFDGDGRRDIWSSPADVFASIANYLKAHGWTSGQAWGREVAVSREAAGRIAGQIARRDGSCQATRDMTVALPMAQWTELGVRPIGSRALPKTEMPASLVSGSSRHFLVYENYDALLEYNCAHSYALSVALLADRIPERR